MTISKKCSICEIEKPIEEYRKQAATKDGYRNTCKLCQSADAKRRYLENREGHIMKVRQWQSANAEKIKESKNKDH